MPRPNLFARNRGGFPRPNSARALTGFRGEFSQVGVPGGRGKHVYVEVVYRWKQIMQNRLQAVPSSLPVVAFGRVGTGVMFGICRLD